MVFYIKYYIGVFVGQSSCIIYIHIFSWIILRCYSWILSVIIYIYTYIYGYIYTNEPSAHIKMGPGPI